MMPWQDFWFPQSDENPAPTRDAALWTPQAFAEGQRAMWQQAAEALDQWFGFWRLAWPSVPLRLPLAARAAAPVVQTPPLHAEARPARPATRRGAVVAAKPAARGTRAATAKSRPGGRGK